MGACPSITRLRSNGARGAPSDRTLCRDATDEQGHQETFERATWQLPERVVLTRIFEMPYR